VAQAEHGSVNKQFQTGAESGEITIWQLGVPHDPTVLGVSSVVAADMAVLNASAAAGATAGSYDIEVTSLAKAHSIGGKHFDDTSMALQLSGSFSLNGASIGIGETDTLTTITDAVNKAVYADGKQVNAAIVHNQLVLSAAHTDLAYAITGDDSSGTLLRGLDLFVGGAVQHELQTAANAQFIINTMLVSRSSNTGLTDVIDGVTLNLTKEGKSSLSISSDANSATNKVNDFIAKFNDALSYVKSKTSTTKVTSASEDTTANPTYQHAALAGDSSMLVLRAGLYSAAMTRSTNSGLADIGIEFDSKTMELKVSNATNLATALTGDFAHTSALLKDMATAVAGKLSPFVQSDKGLMARRHGMKPAGLCSAVRKGIITGESTSRSCRADAAALCGGRAMRVYREFIVDENTRRIEVHCIDEATGREVSGLDSTRLEPQRLNWDSLAYRGALANSGVLLTQP
jgi:flagellar capping protein FliD